MPLVVGNCSWVSVPGYRGEKANEHSESMKPANRGELRADQDDTISSYRTLKVSCIFCSFFSFASQQRYI